MSYSNYPKAARNKAKSAIKRNKKKNNKCATQVGKVRARQLAKGEPISKKTVRRTFSYLSRGKAYADPNKPNSCGSISYDLWGGDPMLKWTKRTLKK